MGLEDNIRREREERIAVSEDRLKNALHEFKDELFEKIDDKFATKSDVKLWIGLAVLGIPSITTLLTTIITRQSPPEQASAIVDFVGSLF